MLLCRSQTAFFFFLRGGGKRVWWISNRIWCGQIYNFWGLLITTNELQRPANEARMKKEEKKTACMCPELRRLRAVFHSRFVRRPLLFISSNQQSPKVVRFGCTKILLKIHQTLFSPPPLKKAVWARD